MDVGRKFTREEGNLRERKEIYKIYKYSKPCKTSIRKLPLATQIYSDISVEHVVFSCFKAQLWSVKYITVSFISGMWAHSMTVQDYQDLIDRGWRR